MGQYIKQLATIIFSSSAIMIGIALIVISSWWKDLNKAVITLPADWRKLISNLKNMRDKRKKFKKGLKGSFPPAILFFGLTIISSLIAMGFVTRTMLNTHGGLSGQLRVIRELHNCTFGLWTAIVGAVFLAIAVLIVVFYKLSEFRTLKKAIWKS